MWRDLARDIYKKLQDAYVFCILHRTNSIIGMKAAHNRSKSNPTSPWPTILLNFFFFSSRIFPFLFRRSWAAKLRRVSQGLFIFIFSLRYVYTKKALYSCSFVTSQNVICGRRRESNSSFQNVLFFTVSPRYSFFVRFNLVLRIFFKLVSYIFHDFSDILAPKRGGKFEENRSRYILASGSKRIISPQYNIICTIMNSACVVGTTRFGESCPKKKERRGEDTQREREPESMLRT